MSRTCPAMQEKKKKKKKKLSWTAGREANRASVGKAGVKDLMFTPDGPKWTARSGEGVEGREGAEGCEEGSRITIPDGPRTARSGGGCGKGARRRKVCKATMVLTPHGPKWTARNGSDWRWWGKGKREKRSRVLLRGRLDYFVLPVPFPLPFIRGESEGLASEEVSLPCVCLCLCLSATFAFSFALRWGTHGVREVDVVIEERALKGLGCGCVRRTLPRRVRALRAGAGIGPEGPCGGEVGDGKVCSSRRLQLLDGYMSKFLSSISAAKLLSRGPNMRARIS